MRNTRRVAATVACVGLIVLMLVSSLFLAHAAEHDCIGEDCPVCLMIEHISEAQRGLSAVLAMLSIALFALSQVHRAMVDGRTAVPFFTTLVFRKIQLND